MPIYVYESKAGDRVERYYPIERSPKRVRHEGRFFHRIVATAPSMRVDKVEGLHGGPPGQAKVQIRNKRDIAEMEARIPGLKYNPEFYRAKHERE